MNVFSEVCVTSNAFVCKSIKYIATDLNLKRTYWNQFYNFFTCAIYYDIGYLSTHEFSCPLASHSE